MTFYFILIIILPPLATWGLTRRLARQSAPACRGYLLSALASAVIPLLLIPLVVLVISGLEFSGTCYGFTNGSWPCPFSEFFINQLFWGSLIFFPAVIPAWIGSAVILLVSWFKPRPEAAPPETED